MNYVLVVLDSSSSMARNHEGTHLLGGDDPGLPDVRLTIVDAVQGVAIEALGRRTGAVVALDPRSGAVLAYVSAPGFDPNRVVAGEMDPGDEGNRDLLLDRVASRLLPPGSTFKVVVAAAALAAGFEPDSLFADTASYTPPGGMAIGNATGRTCAGGAEVSLRDALVFSCNTVFAALAVELGATAVVRAAEAAGFNVALPWELGAVPSVIPGAADLAADPPALAQSGIGERDVRATPLQMALLAAAVANQGVAPAPYVVEAVLTGGGQVLRRADAGALGRVFSASVAADLLAMMEEVVERGTGTAAAVDGVRVAGKTGTAEGGGGPHAWFIAVAPVEEPTIAVAVVVESADGSGGRVAAPIARQVITAWLGYLEAAGGEW